MTKIIKRDESTLEDFRYGEAERQIPDLATISTDQLRTELARGLTLTADTLTRLGMVWAELERRGEDLSDLRHGLARMLPLIAAGRLAAEAVVAFSGRPALLRAIEGVPLDQQRRYAAGEPIQVIAPDRAEGVLTMPLGQLPAAALRVVFADGEVRTPEAQRLAFRPRNKNKRREEGNRWRPRYDRASGTVMVGRMTIQVADLLGELSAAAGPDNALLDAEPDQYVTAKVRLTRDEAKRLVDAAKRTELPDWELIRKAMRAFGLI